MTIVESTVSVHDRIEIRPFAWAGQTWLRNLLMAIIDVSDYYHVFINVAVAVEGEKHKSISIDDWVIIENGDKFRVIWKRGRHMMLRSTNPFIDYDFNSHDDYSLTGMKVAILGNLFKEGRSR